jgi:hypothetical protein
MQVKKEIPVKLTRYGKSRALGEIDIEMQAGRIGGDHIDEAAPFYEMRVMSGGKSEIKSEIDMIIVIIEAALSLTQLLYGRDS